ncbi:Hypothetical predicted protein [Cloeon dipterum]|uniref:Uncharacterized protein n=1 Tax=Cloeon dipterum TaxID=197152 RepID=A0A8S1DBP3_9INSE|nr:Hypothetical predicted protein [Cloeon dipterum]
MSGRVAKALNFAKHLNLENLCSALMALEVVANRRSFQKLRQNRQKSVKMTSSGHSLLQQAATTKRGSLRVDKKPRRCQFFSHSTTKRLFAPHQVSFQRLEDRPLAFTEQRNCIAVGMESLQTVSRAGAGCANQLIGGTADVDTFLALDHLHHDNKIILCRFSHHFSRETTPAPSTPFRSKRRARLACLLPVPRETHQGTRSCCRPRVGASGISAHNRPGEAFLDSRSTPPLGLGCRRLLGKPVQANHIAGHGIRKPFPPRLECGVVASVEVINSYLAAPSAGNARPRPDASSSTPQFLCRQLRVSAASREGADEGARIDVEDEKCFGEADCSFLV